MDKKELIKILKEQGYDAAAEEVAEQVADNFRQASNEAIYALCERMRAIDELLPSDATKISNVAKRRYMKEIESILANASSKSIEEIDSLLEVLAQENDNLASALFEYKNKKPTSYKDDAELKAILETSAKSMKKGMINISNTSALRVDMNNNLVTMDKAYVRAINQSIFATQQGYTDYYTAIRQVVLKMSADGVKKVVLGSGRAVRLDSQARMNVLEGVRMFNQEYRRKQGEQFGADGVEISAHFPCAPDHIPYQGKQYSNKEFDKLQSNLERPIGKMNCGHSISPIILGVSKPVYTEEELKQAKEMSEKEVEYTDARGVKRKTTGYGATQVQRYKELQVRKLKDEQRALEAIGDTVGAKEIKKKVTKAKKEYYRVCEEMGVPPRSNRLDYIKTSKPIKTTLTKSIDIDDMKILAYNKNINKDVVELIGNKIKDYEGKNEIYISDVDFKIIPKAQNGAVPVLQIEPSKYGLLKLNVNTDVVAGKNIDELNRIFKNAESTVINNLEEAVIHECGHAKMIKGKTVDEIEKIYDELSKIHIKGISKYAYSDGAECIAEIEVLLSRKENVSKEAMELYNKYMRGK